SWRGDYLNWSTDFKGGTEIIFGFHEKGTDQPAHVDPGRVRAAFDKAGFDNVSVSDFTWQEQTSQGEREATGILVRTPEFGAVDLDKQMQVADAVIKEMAAIEPIKVNWSGDRLFIKSKKAVDWKAAQTLLARHGLKLRTWDKEETDRYTLAEQGTGEHSAQLSVEGIDANFRNALVAELGQEIDIRVDKSYGVGAKAGEKLRNDGVASLFYALLLVVLYLVVRFDLRYAPGALRALLLDATVVVGVFAATWTEFSLTTVAAILTVIGYSVNDTVVIYDRIRENMRNLKDKKLSRIMNISVNEMLSRTLLTNLTVFAVTLMMNIFAVDEVRNFAFAMNIAAVVGTYSSLFIAAPLALWIHTRFYEKPSGTRAVRGREEAEGEDEGGDRV
ncbi:MAG TPA: protein translocase subunit SecF, partial [Kofleriaceae bacterium]|nr:protein translocase subunit SecF [Kofleriaceae bacterium]